MNPLERVQLAKGWAKLHSNDKHHQTGALIVTLDGQKIYGANSLPSGCEVKDERLERPRKYRWMEHSERVSIYKSAQKGIALLDADMYVTWFPCSDCARAIINSGIKKLYCFHPDLEMTKWGEDFKESLEMLEESKVELIYLD
jgi:dCMP deaminase